MQKFPSFLTSVGLSLGTVITLLTQTGIVFGQAIQNDNTLSTNGFTDSVVNQMGTGYTITGGTEMGANLFHSFSEFSVPNFGRAFFDNNPGIENIISRVTGSNISTIEGIIQANGAANLFLINPNGITIGPNAGLAIGGSFVATTADSIELLGGGQFSAKNPNGNGTLLTMTAPFGLQMGTNPGQITVEGFGNNLVTDPNNFEIIDLPIPPNLPPQIPPDIFVLSPFAVNAGETLALVGGDIVFNGGNVEAVQGRVELAAFSNGRVNLTTSNGQLQITPPTAAITYRDISLSGASSVDVSGNSGGTVQVQGRNLILSGGSVILANTTGNGLGGEVIIQTTDSIEATGIGVMRPIFNRSGVFAHEIFSGIFAEASSQTTEQAQAGTIRLNTGQLRVTEGAQIGANTFGSGRGGQLMVNAHSIDVNGASFLGPSGLFTAVAPNASGDGGHISLNTNTLNLTDGANINFSSFPLASGNGGTANIEAVQINISGTSAITGLPTGIIGNVEANATGQGGDLTLRTHNLSLKDGGNIALVTLGQGNAGTASIEADNIEIVGASSSTGQPSGIFNNVGNNATGQGGRVNINAGNLQLREGGQIGSLAFGSGNAGTLDIRADSIDIQGTSSTRPSGIVSQVGRLNVPEDSTSGNGGNIIIDADRITLREGGIISTNTAALGQGGNIEVNAEIIEVRGGAQNTASGLFSAVSARGRGNGGQIRINTGTLQVTDGGQISVSTEGFGNGGNLNITARSIELLGGSPLGASGLFANAIVRSGDGGNIDLVTENLTIADGATINVGNFPSVTDARTPGTGSPGNITIDAQSITLNNQGSIQSDTLASRQGNIRISSDNMNLNWMSRISANAEGDGDGGNINIINNDDLTVKDMSEISTNTQGRGQGGNIEIVTGSLTVESDSKITSDASAASGGNIQLRVTSPQTLTLDNGTISATGGQGNITVISPITFLRNGSLISTNGIGTEPGGNIIINTDFVLSVPTENNDITANAQQSLGGRVIINALGVFGIEFREFLTPLSDITVTSELGPAFSGEVFIRVPEGDPTSGFTRLPEDTIDVSDLIVIACAADEGSIFIRTGRGGIPDNPEQPLRRPIIWEDLRDFIELEDPKTEPSSQSNAENYSFNCSF